VWSQAGTYSATQAQEHYASELESAQRINLAQGQQIFDSGYLAKRGTCSIFWQHLFSWKVLFLTCWWLGVAGLDSYALSPSSADAPHRSLIYAIVIEIFLPPCPLKLKRGLRLAKASGHGPFRHQL
jgi:hypothetical protein